MRKVSAEQSNSGLTWLERLARLVFYMAWTVELVIVIIDKSALVNPYESYLFRGTFAAFLLCLVLNGIAAGGRTKRQGVQQTGALSHWSGQKDAQPEALQRSGEQESARRSLLALVCFLAGAVLGFVSWRVSGRNDLLRAVVFVAACSTLTRQEICRVMKYTLYFTIAGCLLLVVLSLTGVMGSVSLMQEYGHGVENRYTLGLGHPNALHCMAMMLILLGLYVYAARLKVWIYGCLFIFNLLLYYLTRSNTGFLIATAGILLSALFRYSRKCRESAGLYLVGEGILVGGLVISLVGAICSAWSHPLIGKLDHLLTGRIASLWETTFREGTLPTWRWFGSRDNQAYFDLGYVRLAYWYGVIPAVLLLILLFAWLRQLRLRHDWAAFTLLICCAIYTVPEAHLVSVYLGRNYCLLLLAMDLPQLLSDGAAYWLEGKFESLK